jgi:hypothetical protein
MKLDQFMLRFRDEVALKRERNRDENYKHGQFESDSEDDAVVKSTRGMNNILDVFTSAPKDA